MTGPQPKSVLAPFVLERVALFPLGAVAQTVPPSVASLISRCANALAAIDRMRPDLVAALYDAIPHLSDKERRVALELKRAVYGGRKLPTRAIEARPGVGGDARLSTLVSAYLAAEHEADAIRTELDATVEAEMLAHVYPHVHALITDESFLRPLVVASPSLYRSLVSKGTDLSSDAKLRRSVVAYLMRACAKTTPFSTFAVVRLMTSGVRGGGPSPASRVPASSTSSLPLSTEFASCGGLPARCGRLEHCRFRIDPTVSWRDRGAEAFKPITRALNARLLRGSEPISVRMGSRVFFALTSLTEPFTWRELVDNLIRAGILEDAAGVRVREMFDSGLIVPDPSAPVDALGGVALNEAAGVCGCDQARSNERRLARMRERARRVATATSAERARLLAANDEDARTDGPFGGDRATTVFETGFVSEASPSIERAVEEAAREIGDALAPRVELSRPYQLLSTAFARIYGAGGRCFDVVDFLRRVPELVRDGRAPTGSTAFDLRPARVPVTVLFQLDRAGPIALNAIHAGCGWLSARYALGAEPFHHELTDRLRDWLLRLAAPARPADLRAGGNWNELQRHPPVTDLAILPPGELPTSPAEITWRDLVIARTEHTGQIQFLYNGAPVAPFYLGASRPHPGWGPAYWLLVLASPFTVRPVFAPPPSEVADQEVLSQPRDTVGRVVLRRAQWWMRTSRLRRVWFNHTGGRRLLDVRFDCHRAGIPERSFVRTWSRPQPASAGPSKPIWIDVGHPLFLELLEAESRDTELVCFAEMLPELGSPDDRSTEIHAEMALL